MRFSFMSGMAFRIATSKKLWKKEGLMPETLVNHLTTKGTKGHCFYSSSCVSNENNILTSYYL
jgi:hypothetical protein